MNTARARRIAMDLIRYHLGDDWRFSFLPATLDNRFGDCVYREKRIRLSLPLTAANNETEVIDTILHEIAHALVPPVAPTFAGGETLKTLLLAMDFNYTNGHTTEWMQECLRIGGNGERHYLPKSRGGRVVVPPAPVWTGMCYECGHEYTYKRAVRNLPCRSGFPCRGSYHSWVRR